MSWLDDLVTSAQGGFGNRERSALLSRGVSDEQVEQYRLGYINRKLPTLKGAEAFLKWSNGGSKLDDVFVLPLVNSLGDLKGVQFRHVERERGGYMDYFVEQNEPVFFGLAQAMPAAWKTSSLYLVEGAFDLFPVQRTFPETMATLTARVTDPLIRFMRRFIRHVWLGYDMDGPGRRACTKFVRQYGQEFTTKVVAYPVVRMVNGKDTKDPSDLWETWGEGRFSDYLRSLRSDKEMEFGHG